MVEVMIAITIIAGAVLYVYTAQTPEPISLEDYIYTFHVELLSHISVNDTLRSYVLAEDEAALQGALRIPSHLDFSVRICDLSTTPSACNLDGALAADLYNAGVFEIYARETIVASNLTHYDPKKVKLFIWEKPLA